MFVFLPANRMFSKVWQNKLLIRELFLLWKPLGHWKLIHHHNIERKIKDLICQTCLTSSRQVFNLWSATTSRGLVTSFRSALFSRCTRGVFIRSPSLCLSRLVLHQLSSAHSSVSAVCVCTWYHLPNTHSFSTRLERSHMQEEEALQVNWAVVSPSREVRRGRRRKHRAHAAPNSCVNFMLAANEPERRVNQRLCWSSLPFLR